MFWQRPFLIGSSIERGAEQILGLFGESTNCNCCSGVGTVCSCVFISVCLSCRAHYPEASFLFRLASPCLTLYSLLEDSLLPGLSFRFDFRSGWSGLLCHRLIGKFEIISAGICLRLCSLVSVCCSFSIAVEFHFRQNQIGFEITRH